MNCGGRVERSFAGVRIFFHKFWTLKGQNLLQVGGGGGGLESIWTRDRHQCIAVSHMQLSKYQRHMQLSIYQHTPIIAHQGFLHNNAQMPQEGGAHEKHQRKGGGPGRMNEGWREWKDRQIRIGPGSRRGAPLTPALPQCRIPAVWRGPPPSASEEIARITTDSRASW